MKEVFEDPSKEYMCQVLEPSWGHGGSCRQWRIVVFSNESQYCISVAELEHGKEEVNIVLMAVWWRETHREDRVSWYEVGLHIIRNACAQFWSHLEAMMEAAGNYEKQTVIPQL